MRITGLFCLTVGGAILGGLSSQAGQVLLGLVALALFLAAYGCGLLQGR